MKTLSLLALLLAAPAVAQKSPLEADYPDGYWDREIVNYGRQGENYNVTVAAEDPQAARAAAESILKAAGGKLLSFNDMTAHMAGMGMDQSMMRMRAAYSMSYRLPDSKAAAATKKLMELGRLTQYSTGSPYGVSQTKEADERVAKIEKEKKDNAAALKTMPIARALLESKLKRLRGVLDGSKETQGTATVTLQLMKELPEGEKGGRVSP